MGSKTAGLGSDEMYTTEVKYSRIFQAGINNWKMSSAQLARSAVEGHLNCDGANPNTCFLSEACALYPIIQNVVAAI